MWTKTFWKQTAELAIRSFAQGVVIILTGLGLADFSNPTALAALIPDWQGMAITVVSLSALYSVISVASSLVTAKIGPSGTPLITQPESGE